MRIIGKRVNFSQLRPSSKSKLQISLWLVVSLALIGFGAYGLWQKYQFTNRPPIKADDVVIYSTDKPDETPVKNYDDFKAVSNTPRKISIRSIGIDGCIQKVGIDQNKAIAVPTNVHVAGWYVNSPSPGEKGVSVIDGHFQGRYSDAIFDKIKELTIGEDVKIILGDGSERNFKIVSVNNYSVREANTQQYNQLAGVNKQLTLITCGGRYDTKTKSYDKRVIVRAKLIDNI